MVEPEGDPDGTPACNLSLQAGRRHIDARMAGVDGVPEPGQHICDRIGHVSRPSVKKLPAALDHAGHFAAKRVLAEAEAAERELAHVGARAAAPAATVAAAHLELDSLGILDAFCSRGHRYVL
jgi:hypothetical protein